MKAKNIIGIVVLGGALGLVSADKAWVQTMPEPLAGMKRLAMQGKVLREHLPERAQQLLSPGGQRLVELGKNWDRWEELLQQARSRLGERRSPVVHGEEAVGPKILAPKVVSNPSVSVDLRSRMFGFTQSETSVAWCGTNVVTGWNDSGSQLEQALVSPTGSFSFNGRGRSTTKGTSFADLGFLNSDPVPAGSDFYDLGGDPVLQCGDQNTFYYASLATNFMGMTTTSDISVSKSTDGGLTFGGPVPAASKDGSTHFLDKEWMAVDPTNTSRLYVTYTDFDFSGASLACGATDRTAIELVRSTDGGASWSAPLVLEEVCGAAFVQGSQVTVGSIGEVLAGWERFEVDFFTRSIRGARSNNNGVSFLPLVTVSDVTLVGDEFGGCCLQGNFRTAFEFPSVAVDRSGKVTNGVIYVCWTDGRNASEPDQFLALFSIVSNYNFGDILCTASETGGATWEIPVRVNTDTKTTQTQAIDQWQPAVAVDKNGKIGVLFHDRRGDARNFLFDIYFASAPPTSTTIRNKKVTKKSSAPVHFQDGLINTVYMGDYIGLASDFTRANTGFIGAWAENSLGDPNIQAGKL